MGWCESPPLFCAASETAIYVIYTLLQEIKVLEHPLEDKMLAENSEKSRHRLTAAVTYKNLNFDTETEKWGYSINVA